MDGHRLKATIDAPLIAAAHLVHGGTPPRTRKA
jgi:hypothetical protein